MSGWLGIGLLACTGADAQPSPPVEARAERCVDRIRAAGTPSRRNEPSGPQPALPTAVLTMGTVDVVVEVADAPSTRAAGLMFRDALAPDAGMLFVYPDARHRSFWMRNTCVPLSIAYLGPDGRIVSLADMQPLVETAVPSGKPAQYALEMEQGWFARKGVGVGDTIVGLPPASTY